ncbi:MAG TPA: HEAT repeat domain-containing protein [Vicinamibacterales bacterium]|nr:HEAT repeat domain-containing protein [Vicinamibacterales bacterium]
MNDAAGVGVLTTDRQLRVRSWNPWLAAATGRDEAQVLGRPLEELTGGPTSAWYQDLFVEVIESGTPRVLAPAFHRFLIPCPPQGPSAHFDRMQQRVTVAPLRHDAAIVGLIITVEDVTWRLDAERELAAELQRTPNVAAAVANVGAPDWRMRRIAVEALRRAASRHDIEHLIQTLRRDHHDINVLSSALQVLVSADIDVAPALVDLLSDTDANLRMHAALALGQLRSHAAVPALINALEDRDANVRFHAIEALGNLAASDAVEPLAAIAASGDFFLAFAAIDALRQADDARVTPRLCGMLGDQSLRPAVVDTLGSLGDEDCVAPLVALLGDDADNAAALAAALERIHGRYEDAYQMGEHIADLVRATITPAGIATLSHALARASSGGGARPLITVLGWAGAASLPALLGVLDDTNVRASVDAAFLAVGAEAVEPLLRQLEDGTRDARIAAATLLGRLGDQRAVAPLIGLLDAADAELAVAAAGSLASLGDSRALDGLLALFAHPRASARQAAISAVNAIGAESTPAAIAARLTDSDPRVRECAIRVAGYFGFADCAAPMLTAVDDADEDVRRAAIEQLPLLRHAAAVPALASAMSRDTPRNRAAAAHTAGFADDATTEEALLRALDDGDAWVRYFAAGSIGRRQILSATPAMIHLALHDPAAHVRIAAMHALGVLDAPHLAGVAATLIREDDADLAAAALAALSSVSDPGVDDLLEETARGANAASRIPAVQAMASRPRLRSVDVLAWAARIDEPRELRRVAIEGLRRLAQASSADVNAAAVEALLGLSAERDTRDEALAALASLPETAVEPAGALLTSGPVSVRLGAVEALARMRHPSASAALARGLDDPVPAVRSAVVGAFGRLGTRAVGPRVAAMRQHDADDGVRRRAGAVCERYGWGTDS